MLDIAFRVQWSEDLQEWRVTGSGGHYATAKFIDQIPAAIRCMLQIEGDALVVRSAIPK